MILQLACIGISVNANWRYQCDQPITLYLITYAIHLVLSTMVNFYVQLKTDIEDEDDEEPLSQKLISTLDAFGLLWFVYGNYIIFSTSNCGTLSSYDLIIFLVIYGYIVLVIPALFSLAFIVLPIYFLFESADTSQTKKNLGASEQEIIALTSTYINYTEDNTRENKNETCESCVICLSEYESGEEICKLWCKHQFHKDCLHDWLIVNAACPMCKRDFRKQDLEQIV
ncbi:hypothetical protein K501DRAFT_306219 [Backusella circina FSU 941]|nr:hypothetical protein K501DRAFT_306219 [Backusella circina FSU 941]